jgi:hypothetical protein
MLRQLLHDFGKIDGGEEVPPGEVRQHLHFLLVDLTVRQDSFANDCFSREDMVFWSGWLGVSREIRLTIPEKAT